jgi:hypothetical protein
VTKGAGACTQDIDIAKYICRRARRTGESEWLIRNLRSYLKGFCERRNRPEAGKISQKCCGIKYEDPALTIRALTMPRRPTLFADC